MTVDSKAVFIQTLLFFSSEIGKQLSENPRIASQRSVLARVEVFNHHHGQQFVFIKQWQLTG